MAPRTPELVQIPRDSLHWDSTYNYNLQVLGINEFPMKFPVHSGDETDITTIFPPGRYTHCILLVNHTTLDQTMYLSNGTTWSQLIALGTLITPTTQTYRKKRLTILQHGTTSFIDTIEENDRKLGKNDQSFKLPAHTGDETDLETKFPADNWKNCGILVYNTTLGVSLYTSDGIIWKRQF